jgi:protein-S-isoprenylcysteine O-methyltransferase Ste14
VRFFRYVALIIFFLDLPVPIYWFVLHPFGRFWSSRICAAFWIATVGSWIAGGAFVIALRHRLIAQGSPSIIAASAGLALICVDFLLLRTAARQLGGRKLVGHAELAGKTELVTSGIYSHFRHPRYVGMIAAVLGACVIAGSVFAWLVGGLWFVLVLTSIFLEEREMRQRFGSEYDEYCHAVPRFFPKFRSR